ncbi:hypothetical protein EYF80_018612 [Liparis tanakae]|uniref:Uncharacterized protein n=1 Tax=Liparis tanakae TaxID=230148 RepID=A0A4Z2I1H7_9TELE|nr:hypothetical protein EYF80_018612 [Liparis tanakae]
MNMCSSSDVDRHVNTGVRQTSSGFPAGCVMLGHGQTWIGNLSPEACVADDADECGSRDPGVLRWASVCPFSSVSVIPRCQSRFSASFNAVIRLTLLGAGTDGVGVGRRRTV